MTYFVRTARVLVEAVLLVPILALSLAASVVPALSADIVLPLRSAMPPPLQQANDTFRYGLIARPDLSSVDDDYAAAATIVSTANAVAAFCSSEDPAAFRDRIAPSLASAEELSHTVSAYADQVYVKRTGQGLSQDAKVYLQKEESQARAWASFIDKIAAALRAARSRVYTADVVQCGGRGTTIDAACVQALSAFSFFVGTDGGYYLEGKRFSYERGEPGKKGYLAVNITVQPALSCKEGDVTVSVYTGYGQQHQDRHFRYDVIAGTMPPYPDIYPEQLVSSVQFIFDPGSKEPIHNPSYSAHIPDEASQVTRIDFYFRNGLKDTDNKPKVTKVSWP
jgi:hypothetical protein